MICLNSSIHIHCVLLSLVYSKPSATGLPSAQWERAPPGMLGQNDVTVVGLQGMPGLVAGDHHLVEFFAGADAGEVDRAFRRTASARSRIRMLGILGMKTSPPHIRSMLSSTKRTP